MTIEISIRHSGQDLRLHLGKRVKLEAITACMLDNVPPSLQLVSAFVVLGFDCWQIHCAFDVVVSAVGKRLRRTRERKAYQGVKGLKVPGDL